MKINNFSKQFYHYLVVQFLMWAAVWIVIIQLPIYVAQKGVPGGLEWDHTSKGILFFWWVLFQNISAISLGYFADKWTLKRSLLLSGIFQTLGYILLATQREFYGVILSVITLGIGTGAFKPIIQGAIAKELNEENASKGWGLFIFSINLASFIFLFLASEIVKISWPAVFLSSASLSLILILYSLFLIKNKELAVEENSFNDLFIKKLFSKEIISLVLIMSGFTLIYMQFYEMLPNFLFDWVDLKGISYLYIYSFNPLLVILLIYPISLISEKFNNKKILLLGLSLVSIGILLVGASQFFYIMISGFIIYTIGEMIVRAKFQEIMSDFAPETQKSLYMSFLQLSYAIGYLIGSISGGIIYDTMGEKAGFAKKYLIKNHNINVDLSSAFTKLQEVSGLNEIQVRDLLWNEYSPWLSWTPFVIVGLVTITAFYFLIIKRNNS